MTVRELYNWCKAQRDKDAEVYLCKDVEKVDEDGYFNELYRLDEVFTQTMFIDYGLDFKRVVECIMIFNDKPAMPNINGEL